MFTIRYHRATGTTTQAASDAIAMLQHANFNCAVFSTSPSADDGTSIAADGGETNWPYFSAAIRVGDDVHVFDSTLLNAVRTHRGSEVRDILDVAQTKARVYFITEGALFTAGMTPEEAAKSFCNRPLTPFTPETRPFYWLKVANGRPEAEYFGKPA